MKTPFKGDWRFWCHFIPNLLGYRCTNNYSNKERFDKVIAEIKWCSFFASQCTSVTQGIYRIILFITSAQKVMSHWAFVCLSVCPLATLRTTYWSSNKEEKITFWKSSASGSGFMKFWKDSSTLRDKAYFGWLEFAGLKNDGQPEKRGSGKCRTGKWRITPIPSHTTLPEIYHAKSLSIAIKWVSNCLSQTIF